MKVIPKRSHIEKESSVQEKKNWQHNWKINIDKKGKNHKKNHFRFLQFTRLRDGKQQK